MSCGRRIIKGKEAEEPKKKGKWEDNVTSQAKGGGSAPGLNLGDNYLGYLQKQGPEVHAICIHLSHAGSPFWNARYHNQSPSRKIILEESKERGKRGDMDRGNPLNLDCGQAKNATDVCIGTLLAMVKLVHNIVSVLRSLCGPPPSKVTLQQNEPILDFVRDGDPSFIYIDSVVKGKQLESSRSNIRSVDRPIWREDLSAQVTDLTDRHRKGQTSRMTGEYYQLPLETPTSSPDCVNTAFRGRIAAFPTRKGPDGP
ncbi:hypothetical protein PCH_Pc18g00990 [Penicillium rubens Wisconsin 54-1255]|uniref:Uncharacterized protein n=1 Tax=Penicillium rubens (strain ATCC 28089 / DSM 1075 / NRRL 1951 / Wisconsin 54-1255) TaxID=500485 RepID=B6HC44_PENRW|nr:hypothetical protein PCH_Pc18g00990 [Penicillium rubens Wisconsin 54-1255]